MIKYFKRFGFITCYSNHSYFFGFRRTKFQLLKCIDLLDKWVVAYLKPNTENCDREAEDIGETNLKSKYSKRKTIKLSKLHENTYLVTNLKSITSFLLINSSLEFDHLMFSKHVDGR